MVAHAGPAGTITARLGAGDSGFRSFVPLYSAPRLTRDALYEHLALAYYRHRRWIQEVDRGFMTPRHWPVASVLVAGFSCCLLPCGAAAQGIAAGTPPPHEIAPMSRPNRPYRGLFGSSVGSATQKLTVEGSFGAAFNAGEPAGTDSTTDTGSEAASEAFTQSGGAAVGTGTVTFSRTHERFGMYASNTSTFEFYPNLGPYTSLIRHVFHSSVYYQPTRSTRIVVGPHLKNLPQFTFADLFDAELGQRLPALQDVPIKLIRYQRYGATVDLSQQLSSRTRVITSLVYAHGKIPTREWNLILVNGKIRHQLTRAIGVYVGGQYGGQKDINTIVPDQRDTQPRLDIGVDLAKEISFSRRTFVGFGTGTAGTHDSSTGETIYRLVGHVRLTREFGRTWLSEVIYSRNVRHIETLNEPVLNNSLTFNVQGSFNRRLQLQSNFGKSIGTLGTGADDFSVLEGGAQVSFALTRELGLSGQYSYYNYSATQGNLIAIQSAAKAFPHRLGVYLQLWLPLIHQTERGK